MSIATIIALYLLAMPIALGMTVTSVDEAKKGDFTTASNIWIVAMTLFWPVLSVILLLTAAVQWRARPRSG